MGKLLDAFGRFASKKAPPVLAAPDGSLIQRKPKRRPRGPVRRASIPAELTYPKGMQTVEVPDPTVVSSRITERFLLSLGFDEVNPVKASFDLETMRYEFFQILPPLLKSGCRR